MVGTLGRVSNVKGKTTFYHLGFQMPRCFSGALCVLAVTQLQFMSVTNNHLCLCSTSWFSWWATWDLI